ncbi:MAG: hypothetical protein RhofKO_24920 [Rhodothermales bacterium]
MDTSILQAFLDRQPAGRTLFHYYRDRYAVEALSRAVGEGSTVHALKRSPLAGLLQRPIVKTILASACADGRVTPERLAQVWAHIVPTELLTYRLSYGRWGETKGYWKQYYRQTTRPGENLVVQLNFNNQHKQAYYRLIRPEADLHPFAGYGHPIRADDELTLAWCRVDIEPLTGEALIEEVQNDWIREADAGLRYKQKWQIGTDRARRDLKDYVTEILKPHRQVWAKAVVTATLNVLREAFDLHMVYFHSPESGAVLKGIEGSTPPRSLYSALPRKLGFRPTPHPPRFVRWVPRAWQALSAQPLSFFRLDL